VTVMLTECCVMLGAELDVYSIRQTCPVLLPEPRCRY